MPLQRFDVVETTAVQYHLKTTKVTIFGVRLDAGYFCLKVWLCTNQISVLRALKMSLFVGQVREIVVTSLDCMLLPSVARESRHWKEALFIRV